MVVDRIAKEDFVLFIGAGVSMNSTNSHGGSPPSWSGLLERLTARFVNHTASAQVIRRLIRAHDYLGAAEHLSYFCDQHALTSDFRNEIVTATDGGDDPNNAFKGADVYDLIGALGPRIIVTTNYDRILERHFQQGFRIKHFEDRDIASTIRQGHPVLLKLHGSADAPEQTILTRTDFTRLRRSGTHALETMHALLLTRTVLFLGYSLDDPDLRLLLENLFGVQGQSAGHYLLGSDKTPMADQQILKSNYGVQMLTYGGDPAVGLKASLGALVEDVIAASAIDS